jgi:solute carrier family 25 (mitochondrial phosphate transporter), member 23/24/25/41
VVSSSERKTLLATLAFKAYSGSVAGGISRTATAPLDRLKTLMQASPPGQPSRGMLAGLRSIYAEGGMGAFFRGNTANVLKIAPETSIKFISFDLLKGYVARDRGNATGAERFVAGGGAGAIGQVAVY